MARTKTNQSTTTADEKIYEFTAGQLEAIVSEAVSKQMKSIVQNLTRSILESVSAEPKPLDTPVAKAKKPVAKKVKDPAAKADDPCVDEFTGTVPPLPTPLLKMKMPELKAFFACNKIPLPSTGSGAKGTFVRKDYVAALEKAGVDVSAKKPAPPKASAKKAAAKKASPKKPAPPKASAKKAAAKKASPKKPAPPKASAKKASAKKASPKKPAPPKAAAKKVAPPKTATKKTAPPKHPVAEEASVVDVSLDEETGFYADADGNVYDAETKTFIGRIQNGKVRALKPKEAVALKEIGYKLWHVSIGKRDVDDPTTFDEIKSILHIGEAVAVEDEEEGILLGDEETPAKEGDILEVDDEEDEGDDILDDEEDEGDIAKATEKSIGRTVEDPAITEEQFAKYCTAQYSNKVNMADLPGVAKASGLSTETVQEILMMYNSLAKKYPDVCPRAQKAGKVRRKL